MFLIIFSLILAAIWLIIAFIELYYLKVLFFLWAAFSAFFVYLAYSASFFEKRSEESIYEGAARLENGTIIIESEDLPPQTSQDVKFLGKVPYIVEVKRWDVMGRPLETKYVLK